MANGRGVFIAGFPPRAWTVLSSPFLILAFASCADCDVILSYSVVCFWCSTLLVFNGASLEALRHIADHQADVESTKHGLLGELCYRGRAEGSHHFGQKWLKKHALSQPH